jgi:hypothetical protein
MAGRLIWTVILLIPLVRPARAYAADEHNFRISGTVVDALSGVPLARAEVFISATNSAGTDASILTESNGAFLFDHLAPGKYILSASHRGYVKQNFQQHENYTTGLAVGVGLDLENVVFGLSPSGSITGQVMDEFTEPVRNAQVILFREGISDGTISIRMQGQVSTDDQGRYHFGRLVPGHYYLSVVAEPWYAQHVSAQPPGEFIGSDSGTIIIGTAAVAEQNTNLDVVYPVTYYSNTTNVAKASAITLQPGELAVADFALRPVPALHLKLTAPLTDLSQGAAVRVSRPTLGGYGAFLPALQLATNKDFIEVGGISPGPAVISLDAPVAPDGKERGPRWQQEIDVSRDTQLSLTENEGRAKISGIVKSMGNASPSQLQAVGIQIRNAETGMAFYTGVSADGKFEFDDASLKPGKYDVAITNPPGFYVDHVQTAGSKVSGRDFEFRRFEPVQLILDVSQGLGSVEGVAVRDSKPVGGVMILLIPQNFRDEPLLFRRDQSDSDGTFTLSQVSPGRYTVVAIENGWDQEWANQDILKNWLGGGELVDVAPNGKRSIKVNVQKDARPDGNLLRGNHPQ